MTLLIIKSSIILCSFFSSGVGCKQVMPLCLLNNFVYCTVTLYKALDLHMNNPLLPRFNVNYNIWLCVFVSEHL